MDSPFVDLKIVDRVGKITFFHPMHNALPSDLLRLLEGKLWAANDDNAVSVILLQSGGDSSFCAGANFDELLAIDDFETGKAFFMGFGRVINAIRKIDKLVVGRIHGRAVGGGVGLAAACDVCFASRQALVRLSELSVGIGPFVIEPSVTRKIGKTGLAALSLHPRDWMSAEDALARGLYNKVFKDSKHMDKHLENYLSEMAAYSTEAMKMMKRMLWHGTEHWDELLEERAEMSGRLVLSDFTKQALTKFKQKK
jgi:methylglutaconyl-CoA hydratase